MQNRNMLCMFVALTFFFISAYNAKAQSLDVALQVLDKKEYPGLALGTLFFIEARITNKTNKPIKIGEYFRILMNEKESDWAIFSMGAKGETNLKAKNLRYLAYGSGSASIAFMNKDAKGMQINFPQSNDVINDSSSKLKELIKTWPERISGNQPVTIRWPSFWFSNTQNSPIYWASPSFESEKERTYYWMQFGNNGARQIRGDVKTLKNLIANTSELPGLRSAAVRWLLEAKLQEEKFLLQFLETGRAPVALAYRCIQALMVWGSASTIDDVFNMWKNKKIAPELDKYMAVYFTWSEHKNAAKAAEKVKIGER